MNQLHTRRVSNAGCVAQRTHPLSHDSRASSRPQPLGAPASHCGYRLGRLHVAAHVLSRLRQLGVRRGIVCSATTSGLSTAVPFQLVAAAAYGTRLVGVRGIVGRT